MPSPSSRDRKADRRPVRTATYVGIDPGSSGGLATITRRGDEWVTEAIAIPGTVADLWAWFALPDVHYGPMFAVIEKVGGYVRGGGGNVGSAMFKFGCGYGMLLMALAAAGVPYEEVVPGMWQKGLGVSPRKPTESKTQWKNRLKAKAQALFPGVTVTLAVADALLIAEYCRRKREGTL